MSRTSQSTLIAWFTYATARLPPIPSPPGGARSTPKGIGGDDPSGAEETPAGVAASPLLQQRELDFSPAVEFLYFLSRSECLSVPQGRLSVAQHAVLGWRNEHDPVPAGTAENHPR